MGVLRKCCSSKSNYCRILKSYKSEAKQNNNSKTVTNKSTLLARPSLLILLGYS